MEDISLAHLKTFWCRGADLNCQRPRLRRGELPIVLPRHMVARRRLELRQPRIQRGMPPQHLQAIRIRLLLLWLISYVVELRLFFTVFTCEKYYHQSIVRIVLYVAYLSVTIGLTTLAAAWHITIAHLVPLPLAV